MKLYVAVKTIVQSHTNMLLCISRSSGKARNVTSCNEFKL